MEDVAEGAANCDPGEEMGFASWCHNCKRTYAMCTCLLPTTIFHMQLVPVSHDIKGNTSTIWMEYPAGSTHRMKAAAATENFQVASAKAAPGAGSRGVIRGHKSRRYCHCRWRFRSSNGFLHAHVHFLRGPNADALIGCGQLPGICNARGRK